MSKRLTNFWKNYKFRFVPWVAFNLRRNGGGKGSRNNALQNCDQNQTLDTSRSDSSGCKGANKVLNNPMIIHHVQKGDDKVISDQVILSTLTELFTKYLKSDKEEGSEYDIYLKHLEIMRNTLGYTIERQKSKVSDDAGTGVFLTSGTAKPGSLIGLYPGTIYMPSEPLFFPSVGNPFIFRCSDGVHIDGNDKWISKSIFKSCAARDKFRYDLPCCDETWLTSTPINALNIGQYVNNRSKAEENNVVYQETSIRIGLDPEPNTLPVHLCKYLPNLWSNPDNNKIPLRIVPLVAIKEIKEGDEILSSYFTVVHLDN